MRGHVHTFADPGALAHAAADELATIADAAIRARGVCHVALSGGSTPRRLFDVLVARGRDALPWDRIVLWWGDERTVPPDHADSNYRMAREALIDPLRLTRVQRMAGEGAPVAAAHAYQEALVAALGSPPVFDLVLLGLGPDGHTASLFPHSPALDETARWVVANPVDSPLTAGPATRLTLTAAAINAARHVRVLVAGADKAVALAAVVAGPSAPNQLPAQLITCSDLVWLVDEAAAAKLAAERPASGRKRPTIPPPVVAEILSEPAAKQRRPDPTAIVIFGATGDLTGRKLAPALFNLMLDKALAEPTVIIGVARAPLGAVGLSDKIAPAVAEHSRQKVEPTAWEKFTSMIDYVSGTFADDATYVALAARLEAAKAKGTKGNRLFYLSTPPAVFPVILEKLHQHKLIERVHQNGTQPSCRVIIEKPFGRDLASARALNEEIGHYLTESQIYRIDHYLGKETVQNILVLRFGNSIFEPIWNRNHIDYVEITAAESIGIEGRGAFYESTGVVRDVIQNHLLQVMSLVTMEVPGSFSADDIRDEKAQVLRAVRNLSASDLVTECVRGQYRGYREEPGVAADSQTPTYAAMRLMIDSWRWQGVPFYLRAGKKLKERLTEVSICFKSVPLVLFKEEAAGSVLQPAVLTLRIQPEEGISLRFVAKVPGENISVGNVLMTMSYSDAFQRPIAEAYERLLLDCMRGDATLFNRRDSVDRAWELIQPLLETWETHPGVEPYEPGSCGPLKADALMARDGRSWRDLRIQTD